MFFFNDKQVLKKKKKINYLCPSTVIGLVTPLSGYNQIAAWLHVLNEMLIYVWKHVAVFADSTRCLFTPFFS